MDQVLAFDQPDEYKDAVRITPGNTLRTGVVAGALGAGAYGGYKLGGAIANRMAGLRISQPGFAEAGVGKQVGGALASLGGDAATAVKTGATAAGSAIKDTVLPWWKKVAGAVKPIVGSMESAALSVKSNRITELSAKLDEVLEFGLGVKRLTPDEFKAKFGMTPDELSQKTKTGKYAEPRKSLMPRVAGSAAAALVGGGILGHQKIMEKFSKNGSGVAKAYKKAWKSL